MDDWLKETLNLQIEAYGEDPSALEGRELATFLAWNHTAAVIELSELLEETRWKPWAVLNDGDPVIPDKSAFIKEAVDVGHFIANMLVAGGVTDDEYWNAYRAKMQVNRERQLRKGGYASRTGVDKCVSCKRSFDDVGEAISADLIGYCARCESELTPNV